jgi:hypothetical protein
MKINQCNSNEKSYSLDIKKNQQYGSQNYFNLMPFKVKDILIVSSLYDAFIIEEEGLIAELVIGEYQHLLLSSPPRITRVSSGKKALTKIKDNHYDFIITMAKNIGMDPFLFGKKIKQQRPEIPIILLATDRSDIPLLQKKKHSDTSIDKIFAWAGDPTLFITIIKYIEDKVNVCHDTIHGNVRVIIMVEDSITDYSMLLPILLAEIVEQTRHSLSDDLNEMQQLVRRRARPKILHAENYEQAMNYYKEYKKNILGILCDVSFKKQGKLNHSAGVEFLQIIRKRYPYLPLLMHSSEDKNQKKAEKVDAFFLNKNSSTLVQDLQRFLLDYLGFGDFVFLLPQKQQRKADKHKISQLYHKTYTKEIARASNMKELEHLLQKVPLESILFHSQRNHFSNWLTARCEFELADRFRVIKASDFSEIIELKDKLIEVLHNARKNKQSAVITEFSKQNFEFDSSFTRIRGDSLGGKGRGLAFMRALLNRQNFKEKYSDVVIKIPNTVVIGTLEFDRFISDNNLYETIKNKNLSDKQIANIFVKCDICDELKNKLSVVLNHFKTPLALRSSSLLEDYQNHPFAGMYNTFFLPNNHKDDAIRLQHMCHAIKLIYASVFFKEPTVYAKSLSLKIEEEKMAIVIQELIGSEYNGRFYPTLSGIAKSYNFYPISHQQAEEGIANIAVGFGIAVVGGEKNYRFSPSYPELNPDFSTPQTALENSQKELYVLNTSKKDFDIKKSDIDSVKKINIKEVVSDESLHLVMSTFDRNDGVIRDGFSDEGVPLITFAGILKYNAFPLASILKDILTIGKKAMGAPVEFEFAVNIDPTNKKPPTFAILQVRPFVISEEKIDIHWDSIKAQDIFIGSKKSLGNGMMKNIQDIVYIPSDIFDSSKTVEIAAEIDSINKKLVNQGLSYVLIGPGRWGTQDRFLGVPVRWSQISAVKVLVETSLKNYNIKPSQGTHFFHNITSRGVAYINVAYKSDDSFIDWKWLESQKQVSSLQYVKHVHLSSPLTIKLDGKKGYAILKK